MSSAPDRFAGIQRVYSKADVEKLRGTVKIEHTLARMGAEKLWQSMHSEPYVHALGALTGQQAVQMAAAGLKAIYLSGWQVAADANTGESSFLGGIRSLLLFGGILRRGGGRPPQKKRANK